MCNKFFFCVGRYAEVGLYQAGNISSSSGASSGSHPASPLPHSLFTHEPLYQFYNAAKVEVSYQIHMYIHTYINSHLYRVGLKKIYPSLSSNGCRKRNLGTATPLTLMYHVTYIHKLTYLPVWVQYRFTHPYQMMGDCGYRKRNLGTGRAAFCSTFPYLLSLTIQSAITRK